MYDFIDLLICASGLEIVCELYNMSLYACSSFWSCLIDTPLQENPHKRNKGKTEQQ